MENREYKEGIVDPFPVEELGNLYRKEDGTPLGRTAICDRMKAIGIKSFGQKGHGQKRFIHAADVLRLNMLDQHIRENGTMADFPDVKRQKTLEAEAVEAEVDDDEEFIAANGHSALNPVFYFVERNFPNFIKVGEVVGRAIGQGIGQVVAPSLAPVAQKTSEKLEKIIEVLEPLPPSPIVQEREKIALERELLAKQREVQEYLDDAAANEWKLTASMLAPMLGLAALPKGKESCFERMGYRFTKAGQDGNKFLWKVEKLKN